MTKMKYNFFYLFLHYMHGYSISFTQIHIKKLKVYQNCKMHIMISIRFLEQHNLVSMDKRLEYLMMRTEVIQSEFLHAGKI
jgi:hypothetical protein